ncbi:hypothetical protein KIS1582_1955 [Cytobacillus firmus]|uniref:Uncharacterized protein n=1 Tax=Cytobacillus firmus TaxID=1399 RepID=A0A800MXL9_CYTFI|nr:hypothetical protein KIS1582_1955 [Cytobacillus firmus]
MYAPGFLLAKKNKLEGFEQINKKNRSRLNGQKKTKLKISAL